MEVPKGIKILTIISDTNERGGWMWRGVVDREEGKPKYNETKVHVVDETDGTYIYAVLEPFCRGGIIL